MIDFGRAQGAAVLFVTNDLKEDWWERGVAGRPDRPRPELVAEFMAKAKGLFRVEVGVSGAPVA